MKEECKICGYFDTDLVGGICKKCWKKGKYLHNLIMTKIMPFTDVVKWNDYFISEQLIWVEMADDLLTEFQEPGYMMFGEDNE